MSKRILVIEDEKFALDTIARILSKEGYEVSKAMNKEEAVDYIDSIAFDLVITDIMLPHLGGFDILDYLKESENNADTPTLISTGMDTEILGATILEADDYITKPYEVSDLLIKISTLLQKSKTTAVE